MVAVKKVTEYTVEDLRFVANRALYKHWFDGTLNDKSIATWASRGDYKLDQIVEFSFGLKGKVIEVYDDNSGEVMAIIGTVLYEMRKILIEQANKEIAELERFSEEINKDLREKIDA